MRFNALRIKGLNSGRVDGDCIFGELGATHCLVHKSGSNKMLKIKGSLWLLFLLAVGVTARPDIGKLTVFFKFPASYCCRILCFSFL